MFLSGGGDMGQRIRMHDWARTPLGEPAGWPQPLKTLVGLMLASRQPMFLAWGAGQTWLYNEPFVPILGGKHPAALGRPALAEVWSEARQVLEPLFDRVFAGEPVHMDDFGLMLDRHGRLEEAHFAFSYTPVRDESGAVAGLFGVCIETTEGVRMQQKLRDADRRKDEFLATLAHELRNPLAPLRNALYLSRQGGADAGRSPKLQQMMERQVDHMVRLVDDLLDVSRISRGKIELRPETVDVGKLMDQAVESTAAAAGAGGHSVVVSHPSAPLLVRGDALRLTQVLCNLINNAIKFSEAGASVYLGAGREGDEVVVVVKDRGIGIPADKLEEIFEMFAQLDRSLARSKSGLGLGLPLARQLVQLHGGSLRASSEGPGRGSEFIVRLPRAP
jgi:signal transduction histidine kinase